MLVKFYNSPQNCSQTEQKGKNSGLLDFGRSYSCSTSCYRLLGGNIEWTVDFVQVKGVSMRHFHENLQLLAFHACHFAKLGSELLLWSSESDVIRYSIWMHSLLMESHRWKLGMLGKKSSDEDNGRRDSVFACLSFPTSASQSESHTQYKQRQSISISKVYKIVSISRFVHQDYVAFISGIMNGQGSGKVLINAICKEYSSKPIFSLSRSDWFLNKHDVSLAINVAFVFKLLPNMLFGRSNMSFPALCLWGYGEEMLDNRSVWSRIFFCSWVPS